MKSGQSDSIISNITDPKQYPSKMGKVKVGVFFYFFQLPLWI